MKFKTFVLKDAQSRNDLRNEVATFVEAEQLKIVALNESFPMMLGNVYAITIWWTDSSELKK